MKGFVEFTDHLNSAVSINPAHIYYVQPSNHNQNPDVKCRIKLPDGFIYVTEAYPKVLAKIDFRP